jgi:phosphoglycerate dehydrogenase-like enzyme
MRQRENKVWDQFPVQELRGSTMGIVGYGDIGRACAKLAKAFGMSILSYRRRPELSIGDELVDESYGPGQLKAIMAKSDFLVVCAPLTDETFNLIDSDELNCAKHGQFIINIGRGPIINEAALLSFLKSPMTIKGAALDVFSVEPLPVDSELWTLPNLLLSPHCADYTVDSVQQSSKKYVKLCEQVIRGNPIDIVDKSSRY